MLQRAGEEHEEVGAESDAYAIEQSGVDIFASEYVVHVASVAVEFATKPCDTALLMAQFLFDKFSDMNRLFVSLCGYILFHLLQIFFRSGGAFLSRKRACRGKHTANRKPSRA